MRKKTRGALAPLLVVAVAACPDSKPGESTGSSTSSPSTTTGHESETTAETVTSSSTTGATTSTATSSSSTSSTSTGSTSSNGTTTDDTTGPIDVTCTYPGSTSAGPLSPDLAPECACIDPGGVLLCVAPSCPTISGACEGGIFDDVCHGQWMYNEAALECALTAARDGTLGTIRWTFSPNSGFSYRAGFLHIVAERRAIRQDVDWVDLGGEVSDTQLWQLKDPQFFQGCLDLPDFCARLHCFFAGTEGNALSLCLPGFYDSDL